MTIKVLNRVKDLVDALCSTETGGRAAGSREGRAAREVIARAFGEIGLDVVEQEAGEGAANLIARLGDGERAVVVGAHYDHLGHEGGRTFWGADDNAAAVAILVETARALAASPPGGRAVYLVAFDAEEPPRFLTGAMGSEVFARRSPVALDRIDLMVALDLCGHPVGGDGAPDEIRDSLFLFGAERSEGTAALVDRIAVDGLAVRRAGINLLPPLSDYHAFERRDVPFLFATGGRWRHYHTPSDTPDKLDYRRIGAVAKWLESCVRAACAKEGATRFLPGGRDDEATIATLRAILPSLARREASDWLRRLDQIALPLTPTGFTELLTILALVESALA